MPGLRFRCNPFSAIPIRTSHIPQRENAFIARHTVRSVVPVTRRVFEKVSGTHMQIGRYMFEVGRYNIRPQRTARIHSCGAQHHPIVGRGSHESHLSWLWCWEVPYKYPCANLVCRSDLSAYLRQSQVRWDLKSACFEMG